MSPQKRRCPIRWLIRLLPNPRNRALISSCTRKPAQNNQNSAKPTFGLFHVRLLHIMQRKPKTNLRIVAVALLVVAAAFLIGAISLVPPYRAIFSRPWQATFTSEADFRFYRAAFRQVCFILFPLIAAIHIWAAWNILKTIKRVPDEPSA